MDFSCTSTRTTCRREFPFGDATVFFPEATEEACTAAVLLNIDPVGMVRGRGGKRGVEDQYVNDRPYVASSLLSVVLSRWFNSALGGRCERKPDLAPTEISLEARLSAVPCRGGEAFLRALFEPLGYIVEATRHELDESMPTLGPSRLFTVTLRATRRLSDLLSHLYVLVPVLDDQKHYWVGDDEVDKLLRHGDGWLDSHPSRDAIVSRYLVHQRGLVRDAIARLTAEDQPDEEAVTAQKDEQEASIERTISLNERRLDAVFEVLKASGAAVANTSESSMGLSTRCPSTWSAFANAGFPGSVRLRCASSLWESKGSSDSCSVSRLGGSMSACSASWPWRASRWTRGCSEEAEALKFDQSAHPGGRASVVCIQDGLEMRNCGRGNCWGCSALPTVRLLPRRCFGFLGSLG